ncbi:hypothetical protein LB572_00955 [Mesorhizobium sp. BH1-1-5]|uniref:hypothetical protein n=1 Tax=Mesorhizobium sp. BH1-1-5 TaxID=2876661 RepID=UPI001CCFD858|nr:hypothetical protein [Mesorhizobium sp. BH1-1-5]MBZ9985657.1 hypothetical protein [Mesorhizobium sp. BH1-1-5]
MANPSYYVEEFLYRGRRSDDKRPTAWHVILGLEGADPAGRPHPPLPIMSSEQAVASGWDVPAILSAINRETLAELEASRAEGAQLRKTIDSLNSAIGAAEQKTAALSEANDKLLADLAAASSGAET